MTATTPIRSPRAIAIGLVWREGRVLVGVRPKQASLAGFHEFPGGKCEWNESLENAVIREIQEETNLLVRIIGCRAIIEVDYGRGPLRLTFYDCLPKTELIPRPPFLWVPLPDLSRLKFPPGNDRILRSLEQHPRPWNGPNPMFEHREELTTDIQPPTDTL